MRKVKVKLYSLLREKAGSREVEVEVADGDTVGDLLDRLASASAGLSEAIKVVGRSNITAVANGRALREGDRLPPDAETIYLLPPSSGGRSDVMVRVLADEPPPSLDEVLRFLSDGEDVGAVAIFVGIVRGVNRGERVRELIYEHAEELLADKLSELAAEAIEKFSVKRAAVLHYVGRRTPGQLTMIVGVSGYSRANAFPALEWLVNAVKHEAPIWKEEVRESGRYFILGDGEVRSGT